jgi:hypothetical protein
MKKQTKSLMDKVAGIGFTLASIFGNYGCTESNLSPIAKEQNTRQNLVSVAPTAPITPVSYKLEDLCDTPIKNREINLRVYIDPNEVLWDYREFKDELFGYIKDFFKENQIKCNINYTNERIDKTTAPNEFALEILANEKQVAKRYYGLITQKEREDKSESDVGALMLNQKGYAATSAGVALVNGGWEEYRPVMTREEIEPQFKEEYKGMTKKDYTLRVNAANCIHEALHCAGLPHPNAFKEEIVKEFQTDKNGQEIPNIMSYQNMNTKCKGLGWELDDLQRKLLHSFISGNNAWKAFKDSYRDLDIYQGNLARANGITERGK